MDNAKKNPALGLIAFIVFIDMAGIGLIVPVMPRLIMGLSGEGVSTWSVSIMGTVSAVGSR